MSDEIVGVNRFAEKYEANLLEAKVAEQSATIQQLKEGLECQIKYCSNGSRHITAVKALATLTQPAAKEKKP